MSMTLCFDLLRATLETLYMVLVSTILASALGLLLGTWLFISTRIHHQRITHRVLNAVINISRSIPFIILLVALIPVTRMLVGTSIGLHAAIVPLTLAAVPFFARLVDNIYRELPVGLLEAGHSMGANNWQMIGKILIPEARPALVHAVTVTAITLVNYSAMAGTVGAGGLGDLAIRYGYQRFDFGIMIYTVVILVIIVQIIQSIGDRWSRDFSKGTH